MPSGLNVRPAVGSKACGGVGDPRFADRLPGGHIVQAQPFDRADQNALAVRADRGGKDRHFVLCVPRGPSGGRRGRSWVGRRARRYRCPIPGQRRASLRVSRRHCPSPDSLVVAGRKMRRRHGDQPAPVGAESDGAHKVFVAAQRRCPGAGSPRYPRARGRSRGRGKRGDARPG